MPDDGVDQDCSGSDATAEGTGCSSVGGGLGGLSGLLGLVVVATRRRR